jgi:hypothetical protein
MTGVSPHSRNASILILAATLSACHSEPGTAPSPPVPPPPPVLLRDVVVSSLPAPYYHFEYDSAGRVRGASFASGLRMYDVIYQGGRISELRNNALGNRDRLEYVYDDTGRVSAIRYVDSNELVYTTLFFSYDGPRLTGIERDRRVASGFIIDMTMSLMYYPDGNLLEIIEHRPLIDGQQTETTTVDHFEQYDDRINIDGFGLIHTEFFDHLVLLPDVQLQKGNPARVTRTGDGLNFRVDYAYTYDDRGRPLAKRGDLILLNGPDAGRRFQTQSVFTYY